MAFDYSASYHYNRTKYLTLKQSPWTKVKCIMKVHLPTNVLIPPLNLNINGTRDNILINDYDVEEGKYFNFKSLRI